MLGLGFALTNFGTKGGVVDTPDLSGSSAAALLAAYGGEGFSMIFDSTTPSLKITDSTTPSNDWDSAWGDGYSVQDFFKTRSFTSYTGPVSSGKRLMQADGYIKPCRHNLLPMSNRFGSGAWTRTAVTSTYGQTDADGGSTASLITESNTATSVLYTTTAFTTAANVPYTISVKIKKGNSTWVRLAFGTSGGTFTNGVQQWYNLDTVATGTAATTGTASHIASTITADTNSYYILTLTASQASTTGAFIVSTATADASATRTTSGTYYIYQAMCNAGSQRLEYVSSEAHNLVIQSRTLGTSWTATDITVGNDATTSPDGTTSAESLTEGVAGTALLRSTAFTVPASSTVTAYFYLKTSTATWVRVTLADGSDTNGLRQWFNLSTGAKGTLTAIGSGTATSSNITACGNGWYLCEITGVCSTSTSLTMSLSSASADASNTRVNSVVYYADCAQATLSSSAQKVIATTTTAQYLPHFDIPVEYNSSDGTVRALRREEARTNLALRSCNFATTWSVTNATIPTSAQPSILGGFTTYKLTGNAGTAVKFINQSITLTAATVYTQSMIVEYDSTHAYVQLLNAGDVNYYANFDLAAGVVGTKGSKTTSSTITALGSNRYRITATFDGTGTYGLTRAYLQDSSSAAYAASSASTGGVILHHAQLEAGSTASSPIVTGSAAVTRAADFITCASTIFPYASGPGTIYAKWNLPALVTTAVQSAVALGIDANDYVFLGANNTAGSNYGLIQSGGVGQATITSATTSANADFKQALAYATNDAAYVVNNGTPGTDASVTLPASATTLIFGANTSNANGLQGYFKEFAYFPSRLTNTQLGTITTA